MIDFHDSDDDGRHDRYEPHRTPDAAYDAIEPCAGAPAVQYPASVCVCDDLAVVGNFEAYGYCIDGGATVAANGHAVFLSKTEIEGTLRAHSGVDAAGNAEVRGDLISTGDVAWLGNFEIGGDINVGGDLAGAGNLEVAGDLRLGGTLGNVDFGRRAPYVSPAELPCPCDPGSFFDVGAAVAAAATDPNVGRLTSVLEGNAALRLEIGS